MKTILILFLFVTSLNISAQNKWLKLNGPSGGLISGLIAKGDTVLAGTGFNKGLIFYSTDRGLTWDKADFKTTYLDLGDQSRINRFIFSNDGGIIAAAGKNGLYKSFNLKHWDNILINNEDFWGLGKDINGVLYAGGVYGTIFKSLNNGVTWNSMNSGTTDPIITFLLANDSSMLAGSYMKVIKKKYNSDNWGTIYFQDKNDIYYIFTDTSNNIYANNNNFIYLSTDAGESWKIINNSPFFHGNYIYECIYNHRIIAAMGDETGWFGDGWGAALSDDQGLTWRWSVNGFPPKFSSSFKLAKSGDDTYVGTISAGVYKSTNFGDSWFPVNNGINAANTMDITFDKDGNLYAACWSDGIFRSSDKGLTWNSINNGLTNVYLYSIIADSNGNLISGTDQGIFRSTNKGENWTLTSSAGYNYAYRLYRDSSNRIYAINYGDGVYRTTDLGLTWEKIDGGLGNQFIFGFAIDNYKNLYAGTRGGNIYKSTNDGTDWSLLRSSNINNCVIDRIVISPNGFIFATNTGEGVIRSTDNGLTWTVQNNGLNSLSVTAFGLNSQGELYMSTNDDKFYYSSDNGNSWNDAISNLNMTTVQDIIFDKDNKIYLGTDESVWTSNDEITPVELVNFTASSDGNTVTLKWNTTTEINNLGFGIERKSSDSTVWKDITFIKGAGNSTKSIKYSYSNNNISPGKYYYRLKQTDVNGDYKYYLLQNEVIVKNPTIFALQQNYPNPFNPSTKIKYSISADQHVTIRVYDILGREIETLVNEEKLMGEYEVKFEARNLSSGVYIYRLTAGTFTQVKKMQFLK